MGRNGTGKSTAELFDHGITFDSGRLIFKDGLRVNRLEQDPPQDAKGTVYSMVARGIDGVGDALASFTEKVLTTMSKRSLPHLLSTMMAG